MASLLKQAFNHSAASTAVNAVSGLKPPGQNNKIGQQIKGPSNDNTLMKQILATHVPDGCDVDVRPLLTVVKDILHRATPNVAVAQERNTEAMEDTTSHLNISAMIEALAFPIHKVGSEMCCKCTTGGGDTRATTLAVLSTLGSYSWDAKLVLSLSAFAVSYGGYCLAAQLHTINPLAKSVALLMQLPHILEHIEPHKHHFDAINDLIVAVIDVTEPIIKCTELPPQYISINTPLSAAINYVPAAVYWTIASIVACLSQINGLTCNGLEYLNSTTESSELSSLARRVKSTHDHLKKLLGECDQHIYNMKQEEKFQLLIRLFKSTPTDNLEVLKELIFSGDGLALVDEKGEKFDVDVLRRKNVILFITDLDVADQEIKDLTKVYTVTKSRKERPYEVVWLPVIDNLVELSDAKHMFEERRRLMPWLSLHSPSLLKPAVIRYIKEKWHFKKQPLFVVLDAQGRVGSPNASHMIRIWGNDAFSPDIATEETLWKEATWTLGFLFGNIYPKILDWVKEKKIICVYGGVDLDWIKNFKSTMMKNVARVEMIYVGKRYYSEDRTRKIEEKINNEKPSTSFLDVEMIWLFWMRLESMLYSKLQLGHTIENDTIMKEVMALLIFDGDDNGWAVISDGSTMVKGNGKIIMDCLNKFETWKERVKTIGFISAMSNALPPLDNVEHCIHLILSCTNVSIIPEHVVCNVCKSPMVKYALYKCCKDKGHPTFT